MKTLQKHTVIQSIALHLLPGILIGGVYYLFVPVVKNFGYPSIMALVVAAILVLVPFELGSLYVVKKMNNEKDYQNIVLNRNPIAIKSYILWIPLIIILSGLVFTFSEPLSNLIRDTIFRFIPTTHYFDFGYSNEYSVRALFTTYTTGFIVLAIIAPIAEELYFRGYLLPRIPFGETSSGILHSFLFAMYHVWTPWMIITRFIGFYPFVFAVQKKKNITIVIIAHCFVNALDFITGFIFLINL